MAEATEMAKLREAEVSDLLDREAIRGSNAHHTSVQGNLT
jgi:hypothetical protein